MTDVDGLTTQRGGAPTPDDALTDEATRTWEKPVVAARAGFSRWMRSYALIVAWVLIIILFSALRPDTFFTTANFETIFGSQAILLTLTLGLLVPFTSGEFDLSIAGVFSI